MNTTLLMPQQSLDYSLAPLQLQINRIIETFMASLPTLEQLTGEERRGIIARYTAVLEGNFIYWMTATLLAVQAEDARLILLENLHDEVRDAHPAMMRRFAIAAQAFPTDLDALAVHEDLTNMRLFLGRLSGVQSLLTMAFFEGFIQKFMPYLAALAAAQGSVEMEYTDVHGICDIAHTAGLFRAFEAENAINPFNPEQELLEGVYLLCSLLETVVFNGVDALSA